jgi:hypothetical protein
MNRVIRHIFLDKFVDLLKISAKFKFSNFWRHFSRRFQLQLHSSTWRLSQTKHKKVLDLRGWRLSLLRNDSIHRGAAVEPAEQSSNTLNHLASARVCCACYPIAQSKITPRKRLCDPDRNEVTPSSWSNLTKCL